MKCVMFTKHHEGHNTLVNRFNINCNETRSKQLLCVTTAGREKEIGLQENDIVSVFLFSRSPFSPKMVEHELGPTGRFFSSLFSGFTRQSLISADKGKRNGPSIIRERCPRLKLSPFDAFQSRPQSPLSFWSAPRTRTLARSKAGSPRITDFRLVNADSEI